MSLTSFHRAAIEIQSIWHLEEIIFRDNTRCNLLFFYSPSYAISEILPQVRILSILFPSSKGRQTPSLSLFCGRGVRGVSVRTPEHRKGARAEPPPLLGPTLVGTSGLGGGRNLPSPRLNGREDTRLTKPRRERRSTNPKGSRSVSRCDQRV